MENSKGLKMEITFSNIKKMGITMACVSGIFLLYLFLEKLNHPVNETSIPIGFVVFFFILGVAFFIFGYYKTSLQSLQVKPRSKNDVEQNIQKEIIKPIQENEVASWKSDGMRQYFEHAKYELNVYIRNMEVKLKNLTQQERELYIIHDLIMRLTQELIRDEITLSCADIYLIFMKLDVYNSHHEKRLYESYKVHLSESQQYKLDLLLDIRTKEILRFSLKDRYAFLPEELNEHVSLAVRNMEIAADEGNVYAQFDLANVYLSSEFYGGMEAAIVYLHRAKHEQHKGAVQLLHQLQHA